MAISSRRVTFDDCYKPAPPPFTETVPDAIPQQPAPYLDLPPQNARHEPYQKSSAIRTVEGLATNGARPPLMRQYVDDPTLDPTNRWWQAISSHPSQQYGRAKLAEIIHQGEILRPEPCLSREPWQRGASLTRLRPPAKLSGIVSEHPRGTLDGDTIYALAPTANFQFPDCTGNPANLPELWKSVRRQPFERPKKVFDKHLIERYPAVYGPRGGTSWAGNADCQPEPLSTSLKPFPYHSIMQSTEIRPWSARM